MAGVPHGTPALEIRLGATPIRSDLCEVVMLRTILLTAVSLYLIAVGIWHGADAPVALAFTGLGHLIGLVPRPVWALAAVAIWLWHRRTVVIQPATA